MALVAAELPDRKFVTKNVKARSTALQAAAFQLQGGTIVRTGLLSICQRACLRSSGGGADGLGSMVNVFDAARVRLSLPC